MTLLNMLLIGNLLLSHGGVGHLGCQIPYYLQVTDYKQLIVFFILDLPGVPWP
jgi:hypothetical protein